MFEEKTKGMPVKVRVNEDVANRLDALAARTGQTRSKVAAYIIKYSLPEVNLLNKLKVFQFAQIFQNVYEKIFTKGNLPSKARIPVGIWLNEEDVEQLDKISKNLGMTRSKFAGNLIDANIPEQEFFENLGINRLKRWISDLKAGKYRIEIHDD